LFLPEGTEMRMHFARQDFHARVVGDHIVYEGQSVSPRQMTIAVDANAARRTNWKTLASWTEPQVPPDQAALAQMLPCVIHFRATSTSPERP
jgi:hypothetical protein